MVADTNILYDDYVDAVAYEPSPMAGSWRNEPGYGTSTPGFNPGADIEPGGDSGGQDPRTVIRSQYMGDFVFPVAGWSGTVPSRGSSRGFGAQRTGHKHRGVDLFAPRGTEVIAPTNGVVTTVGSSGDAGKRVWVKGQDGTGFFFAHLDGYNVTTGQQVKAGDVIGFVGNTGNARGGSSHLHFEMHTDGPMSRSAVDPFNYLTGVGKVTAPSQGLTQQQPDNTAYIDDLNHRYFEPMLGRLMSPQEESRIIGGQWSRSHVENYVESEALKYKSTPGYQNMASGPRSIWQNMMGTDIPMPDSEVDMMIREDWSSDRIKDRIRRLPGYQYGTEFKTIFYRGEDMWERKVGQPITWTARQDLRERIKAGSYNDTEWNNYIEGTDSYDTGVEMESMRANARGTLIDQFGYGVVQQLEAENPNYIDEAVFGELGEGASQEMIAQWAREQPEWIEGPQAAYNFENLRSEYMNVMPYAPSDEYLYEQVELGTTPAQMRGKLRNTPAYQEEYKHKPSWMGEAEWQRSKQAYQEIGRWYYDPAFDPTEMTSTPVTWWDQDSMEWLVENNRPLPDGVYQGADGTFYRYDQDYFQFTPEQMGAWSDAGITPAELQERFQNQELAIANLPMMNYYGEALGKTYTQEDAITYVSGAQGSGKMKADIWRARRMREFDTPFAIYEGHAPTTSDYENLMNNYVSPQHYSQVQAAGEYADQIFDQTDELFMRVFGEHADRDMLESVAMGAEGSGAYEAKMQLAEELDRYRWTHKQYWDEEPTPEDYARYRGYSTPQELQKELRVREMVDLEGPDMIETWNKYWVSQGDSPLTDADVRTIVGQYHGWGEKKRKLEVAAEHKENVDRWRLERLSSRPAATQISLTAFGGTQAPGLRAIGG